MPKSCEPDPTPSKQPLTPLTAAEVAALLGLHKSSVYEAASQGQIPCRRVGRRYLFFREQILDWAQAKDDTGS